MRQYEFMVRWREECEDEETARNVLNEMLGEVHLDRAAELVASDVQVVPREAGNTRIFTHDTEDLHTPPPFIPDEAEESGNAREIQFDRMPPTGNRNFPPDPETGVVHPWDEGARFFPPEHPLYEYETIAIRDDQADSSANAKAQRREIFHRVAHELPRGPE